MIAPEWTSRLDVCAHHGEGGIEFGLVEPVRPGDQPVAWDGDAACPIEEGVGAPGGGVGWVVGFVGGGVEIGEGDVQGVGEVRKEGGGEGGEGGEGVVGGEEGVHVEGQD